MVYATIAKKYSAVLSVVYTTKNRGIFSGQVARVIPSKRGAKTYLNRSDGGAISVTRSRTSFLLGSGVSVIWRGSSRAVQA